ncbi:adenosylcobinamide-phosphate synthase CbiB [Halobellus sp. GM3]|uniref:adenosylcobinamide-phosphate synthase CbiB n=1 Tax=Halobellus sp. GM3 TaxID=3458410 RepID=UPI00403DDD6F
MPLTAAAAVALAAGLDAVAGEPPGRIHPVALFGRVVGGIERRSVDRSRPRARGLLVAFVLPLGFAGVAAAAVAAGARIGPAVGSVVAAGVLFSTTSLRLLLGEARAVIRASDADLDAARRDLRTLAGRDASALDAAHVRSAAVESLAENLADGLVAPLFAFAVVGAVVVDPALALPLAAGAAAWVKAVNTLDSMLGYRSKPIGWAPARLDDAVMWLPARLTALLLAVVGGAPTLPFRRRVRSLARRPSSPNSGWPMATMAALLRARLRKPGAYDLDPTGASRTRATAASLPDVDAGSNAVRLTRRAGALAVVLAGVVAWL